MIQQLTDWGLGVFLLAVIALTVITMSHGRAFGLLLLTAFVPAALSGLHDKMGFLRHPELVTQYECTAIIIYSLRLSIDLAAHETTEKMLAIATNSLIAICARKERVMGATLR